MEEILITHGLRWILGEQQSTSESTVSSLDMDLMVVELTLGEMISTCSHPKFLKTNTPCVESRKKRIVLAKLSVHGWMMRW
jgi:hypothetical protein